MGGERGAALVEEVWGLRDSLAAIPAIVVGNGESRRPYPLRRVRASIRVFGCNALYRDHVPHYLGAVDKLMTDELIRSAGTDFTFVGCRRRIDQWLSAGRDLPRLLLAEHPSEWCTGPMILRTAAILGCDPIYLFGFDVGWTPRGGRINSLYRDTPRYGASDSPLTSHAARWRRHVGSILREFPRRRVLQIGPPTLPVPQARWEEVT